METQTLNKLQSLTEHDLISTVLVPLLSAMGFERVSIEGGPNERGRDLICSRRDELGDTQFAVVQVKRYKPSARASSDKSFSQLVMHLEQAAETPIHHIDGQSYLATSVIFVTPYAIDYHTLESRFQKYAALQTRGLRLIDGPKLVGLLHQYLPELSHELLGQQPPEDNVSTDRKTGTPAEAPPTSDDGNREREKEAFDYLNALHHKLGQMLAPADVVDPHLCFVIMSFSGDPRLADFYEKAIKPTVNRLGYRSERVDEQQFNGSIRQQILENIRRSRFVVADMTEARPNCYYELGVAHATRKEVIHLAYSIDDVHFDVKDFNFIIYSRIDELAKALEERILGTVGSANGNEDG